MRVDPKITDQSKVRESKLKRQDILRIVAIIFVCAIIYFIFVKIMIL